MVRYRAQPLGRRRICTNPKERLQSPQHGLEKHRELKEPYSGFNVEEGAHNRSNWNTAHLIRKCQGDLIEMNHFEE
jgi:hypothetical protein